MNRLAAFLVLVLGVCALPARAALVYDGYPTGPGGFSTPYPAGNNPQVYAGMLEMNYANSTILVLDSSFADRVNLGTYWQATVYTYDDIQAGHGRFTPAQYSQAASITSFVGMWWNMFRYQMSNGGVSQRVLDHYVKETLNKSWTL